MVSLVNGTNDPITMLSPKPMEDERASLIIFALDSDELKALPEQPGQSYEKTYLNHVRIGQAN